MHLLGACDHKTHTTAHASELLDDLPTSIMTEYVFNNISFSVLLIILFDCLD